MRMFEDFVPVSSTEVLVTTGEALDRLDRVQLATYRIQGRTVQVTALGEVLARGENVRLGGMFDGRLVYSSRAGLHGAVSESPTAHQPYVTEHGTYYTDDWPRVTIHRDGERFLGHFGDRVQVGNPCWAGDVMYFECRNTTDPERPHAWEVWKLNGGAPEFVCVGANPAYYDGTLFWGVWNGRDFTYRCAAID